jgi:hypothetical protein
MALTPTDLLESLDQHFIAGCESLSTTEYVEHEQTGSCPACRDRLALTTSRVVEAVR